MRQRSQASTVVDGAAYGGWLAESQRRTRLKAGDSGLDRRAITITLSGPARQRKTREPAGADV